MVVKIRNLKKSKGKVKKAIINKEPEKVKLETSNTACILFQFSFFSLSLLPRNLRMEVSGAESYSEKRREEKEDLFKMGIKPEVQRSSTVPDTGYQMGRYSHCEGGETVFWQLLKNGWKVVDAHKKVQESQESRESGKGREKYQVFILLSKEEKEAKLDDVTCNDILRLMRMTWASNLWDNRHLPQGNIVLNFPLLRKKGTIPKHVLVL